MPRFAANLSMMFNEVPFLERFGEAARAGFDAVEFLFPYAFEAEEVADRLAAHGLEQALFNMPPGNWEAGERGLAALPGRVDEFRASVATALRYAKATGVGRLHLMAGIAPADDTGARARYREALAYAADKTGEAGIDLLIEPINGRDVPGYFLCDFGQAADLIADCGKPNVRLQFDIYHRQILHGDVAVGLRDMMPLIGHVQIASVPARNEPGTGELHDGFVLGELDRLGYAGFVGCEYRPRAGTLDGLGWFEAWRSR